MLIPCLYILSYNLETLKEVASLICDYHNQYYIATTVNNLMTVLIGGVHGQKSSQSLSSWLGCTLSSGGMDPRTSLLPLPNLMTSSAVMTKTSGELLN